MRRADVFGLGAILFGSGYVVTADFGESGATVFLGRSQKMPHGRVFGGQVAGQALVHVLMRTCLLGHAVRLAWREGVTRVHVHTCTLEYHLAPGLPAIEADSGFAREPRWNGEPVEIQTQILVNFKLPN